MMDDNRLPNPKFSAGKTEPSPTNRCLIIGLDGATWTVLLPWIADGSLPNLARLKDTGRWGELRSTIPPLTAPAWSSFITGKNPGKHGVFHFIPLDDAGGAGLDKPPEIVDSRSIQSSTLWDILGHHGRKVGSINVPMSYPPRPVNGFMVGCLLTPPDAPVFTYPPELSEKLPGYQIDLDRFIEQKPFARDIAGERQKRVVKPSLRLVEEFAEMEEIRARTALDLMGSQPWDTFMVVFTATDRMGHYLWPYHFPQGEDATAEERAIHEAIHRFYRRLDEHIGALVAKAGPDAAVIVMSDHGMGPIYSKNTHWNNWLFKNGYLTIDQRSANTPDGWLLRLRLPRDKIRQLLRRIPGLTNTRLFRKAQKAQTARIDYGNSLAHYARIFDPVGGVFIHAAAAGRFAPLSEAAEDDYREELRDELMSKIRDVTDPATGRPIVRAVMRREECYHGPHAEGLPDILILMHPEYGSSDRLSNYSAIVTDRPSIDDPGGHHLEGIFIASGAGVRAEAEPLTGLKIEDIAPTVLHLLDLPVPTDMDGRVMAEILDPKGPHSRPVRSSAPLGRWPSEERAVSILEATPAGEQLVVERLRALGYLE